MISIIIPVYNPGKELERMLNCVRHQLEESFEVILIDDGSSDGSGKLCDEYTALDKRFRVIHQKNLGVSAARNRGMAEAKGEFIAFLDADDEIPVNYFEELLKTQRITNADIVVCDVVILSEHNERSRFSHEPALLSQTDALNLLLSRRKINSGPCAKLFRREVLSGLTFPSLKVYEDILFVRDAFSRAEKIATTDKTEYCYHQNLNSTMHNMSSSSLIDIVKATDDIASFLCERSDLDSYCFYITLSHLLQHIRIVRADKAARGFIKASRILMRKYMKEIVMCKSFPWKEKVLFICFILGANVLMR